MHDLGSLMEASAKLGSTGFREEAPPSTRWATTVVEGAPVFLHPEIATRMNHSPALALVGEAGCGKTVAASALALRLAENNEEPGSTFVLTPGGTADYDRVLRGMLGAGRYDRLFSVSTIAPEASGRLDIADNSGFSVWDVLESPSSGGVGRALLGAVIDALASSGGSAATRPEYSEALREAADGVAREVEMHGAPAPGFRLSYLRESIRDGKNAATSSSRRRALSRIEAGLVYHLELGYEASPLAAILAEGLPSSTSDALAIKPGKVGVRAAGGLPTPPPSIARTGAYLGNAITGDEKMAIAVMLTALLEVWHLAEEAAAYAREPTPAWMVVEQPALYSLLEGGEKVLESVIREGRSRNVGVVLAATSSEELEPYRSFLDTWLVGRHLPDRERSWEELAHALSAARIDIAGDMAALDIFSRLGPGEFLLSRCDGAAGFLRVDPL